MKYKSMDIGQVSPEAAGRKERLAGWVDEVRDLGKIKFLLVRDRTGSVQVTWKKGSCEESTGEVIGTLHQNDVVSVVGTIERSTVSKRGVEVLPEQIHVLNRAKHPLPMDIAEDISTGLDVRLDYRPLDLMRPSKRRIFEVFSETISAVRGFFHARGFAEVVTPRIISAATEGGANLFNVRYFDRTVNLAQSPQLYKEQLVMGLEKVFELGTYFRAEPFDSTRHLNEFVSLDIEVAFADCGDVMVILQDMILAISSEICRNSQLADSLAQEFRKVSGPIPVYKYEEVVNALNEHGMKVNFGSDLSSEDLKKVQQFAEGAYFITDWPTSTKPFYIKQRGEGDVTESFDFMWGPLEVCSGGSREENRDKIEKKLLASGMNPATFEEHLKFFACGMPPHAGWGLGFNRLLMAMMGLSNIREAVLYPRDRFRITP
jgi:nondiscriminating aspartyl-tRNA synthetase